MATKDERITALAQDIYLARHNQQNDVTGDDLVDFQDQTISWVNQFIPEIEKKADWTFLRTNDYTIGTITDADVVSYALPGDVRKLVVSPYRDVSIRFDNSIVATFSLVNPNQLSNPADPYDYSARATVMKRQIIFSRPLTESEVGGDIVADVIEKLPRLSHTDVSLLDILDDENYDDVRQLFIYGVLKNQILPDIVQGGLTPTYAQKFDRYLADCIAEYNASSDADNSDSESFAFISGVGF